jgi:hypothetical protein
MNNIIRPTFLASIVSGALVSSLSQVPKQSAPVPLTAEAHHHLVFSNPEVRAFDVAIPLKDQTLIHRHDVDYVWVGLGDGKVVNATVNKPEIHLYSKDAALHFTRGPLAHAARNEGDTVYRNVTIELLKRQDNPRNLCDQVLENQPTDCVAASPGEFTGGQDVSVRPEFETDEIRFDLLTVGQSEQITISGSQTPPLIIALDETNAKAFSQGKKEAPAFLRDLSDGNVMTPLANSPLIIRNTGTTKARFLIFEFRAGKG